MAELSRMRVADHWPVLHNWAHGGAVSAPELIRECREVIAYLGGDPQTPAQRSGAADPDSSVARPQEQNEGRS